MTLFRIALSASRTRRGLGTQKGVMRERIVGNILDRREIGFEGTVCD